jgi:hypothetical protein
MTFVRIWTHIFSHTTHRAIAIMKPMQAHRSYWLKLVAIESSLQFALYSAPFFMRRAVCVLAITPQSPCCCNHHRDASSRLPTRPNRGTQRQPERWIILCINVTFSLQYTSFAIWHIGKSTCYPYQIHMCLAVTHTARLPRSALAMTSSSARTLEA